MHYVTVYPNSDMGVGIHFIDELKAGGKHATVIFEDVTMRTTINDIIIKLEHEWNHVLKKMNPYKLTLYDENEKTITNGHTRLRSLCKFDNDELLIFYSLNTDNEDADAARMAELGAPQTPNDFMCPITSARMIDPVVASDGHTYERYAIERVLFHETGMSPMTREKLGSHLLSNNNLKKRMGSHTKESLRVADASMQIFKKQMRQKLARKSP